MIYFNMILLALWTVPMLVVIMQNVMYRRTIENHWEVLKLAPHGHNDEALTVVHFVLVRRFPTQ